MVVSGTDKQNSKIKPHFYVYTVYETPDSGFIHDKCTEYYSETPIKIAGVQKYDTAVELDKLGYQMYVLDEPFNAQPVGVKNCADNSVRQNYMAAAIQDGKYHRVNIGELLRQQKKGKIKTVTNNLKSKLQQLFFLQNQGRGQCNLT